MVSLRKRDRLAVLEALRGRTNKIPMLLDPSDYELHVERAVRVLDEHLFMPRSIIFDNADNGLVDVTALRVDEVCTVYYSQDSSSQLLGGLDLGVGIMPILTSQMMPLGSLDSMIDYLILKNVLNSLQRKMQNTFDYTLLPMTSDGRQLLQIRNPGKLFWVEYLPYLDPKADSWEMFESEYEFVLELVFCFVCHANVEIQAQSSILGVGKEAVSLVTYWDTKIKDLVKAYDESSIINYIA